jgi:hypothetical protein
MSLGGMPAYAKPLGHWPDGSPRRLLLVADGGEALPDTLALQATSDATISAPPTASATVFAASHDPQFYWERSALAIHWQGRKIELAMGMRVGGKFRWWEFCRLVTASRSDTCCEIQMAGSIPHLLCTGPELRKHVGYTYPGLHRHHWLSGMIYARLYYNGVCEIFARHVNSRFFDDGLPLDNAVPTVGVRLDGVTLDNPDILGDWDGEAKELSVGGVRVDLTNASHLVSPKQPGRFELADGFVVWQPYQGMELFGGLAPKQLTGDSFIVRAEQQTIPRGMSRTLRLSLSLNPNRSPRVARYMAPAWWYGLSEEFAPAPYLPVADKLDETLDRCRSFMKTSMVRNGFEDGNLPRGLHAMDEGRHEPSWEGEAAGAALLLAYRTGDASDYDDAMRIAYCFNDVYIDHAAKLVRMHGQAPNAFALPMARIHACVYAYLETGDAFCLDAARAVIDTSFWLHKNSWPRVAVGRDACFIRGAMLLYRMFNDPRALEIAKEAIGHVCAVQHPDGWFGDQGGGSGIHGFAAYVVKPWMGLMAVGGLLDYLELFPDGDETALACVKRFADWLMRERVPFDGGLGWGYQHLYNGQREYDCVITGKHHHLPGKTRWHMDYFARLMTFCTQRFRDRSYYQAWLVNYSAQAPQCGGDHGFAQSVQYLPWVQAMTCRATVDAEGVVHENPDPLIYPTPPAGKVMGPGTTVVKDRSAALV